MTRRVGEKNERIEEGSRVQGEGMGDKGSCGGHKGKDKVEHRVGTRWKIGGGGDW